MFRWALHLFRSISEQGPAMMLTHPVDSEEKTHLYHFLVILLIGIPTLLCFGIYHLWRHDWILGTADFTMALSLMLARPLLKRLKSGVWLYRTYLVFFAGILLFMTIRGEDGGSRSLWLFTFPMVAIFLLSAMEGLVWTSAVFAGTLYVFWLPHLGLSAHHYTIPYAARFAAVYAIISALACWFDLLRQHYRKGMETEHQRLLIERTALQEALSNVRQLSGMLPICSSCKKVRDDRGYWTQIESFIRDRSEAEFSHGICPECAEVLYPGLRRKPGNPIENLPG